MLEHVLWKKQTVQSRATPLLQLRPILSSLSRSLSRLSPPTSLQSRQSVGVMRAFQWTRLLARSCRYTVGLGHTLAVCFGHPLLPCRRFRAPLPRMERRHLRSVSSAHKSRLVVLDFDHTIIPADSDELVLAKFSGGLASARARLEKAGREGRWAITFAEELEHLQLNEGVSLGDIREVLKGIKIGPHLKYAMEACSAFSNTDLRIVSDANTWFIKTVLEANGLHNAVSQIVSNIACFKTSSHEDALQRREFLRIEPFHKTPHPKTLHSSSPANLCKGRVMREWLKDGDFELVIYCGDGAGDFEGAMAVPANGLILARSGWALYERLIDAAMQGRGPEAQVLTWDSHMQLGNTLASLCHVPTLREVQGAKGLRAQGQLSSRSPPVPEY